MTHNKHIVDGKHLELDKYGEDWFFEQTKDWKDPLPEPIVTEHEGIKVVRDDLILGTKSRAADLLVRSIKEDTIVYVAPRVGLAGVSILDVASRHNKKVVLFMPASKQISRHQAVCIERGAEPKFYRIAAMPNLNRKAKEYAEKTGGYFIPLGLKHPLVTAVLARVAKNLKDKHGEPDVCFVATSTGVLVRGLQIGWPNTKFYSVAVARNMKSGELGRASVISEPLDFKQEEKDLPPFDAIKTYDAKAWKYARQYKQDHPNENVWLWNVGREPELKDESVYNIDSYREWGEERL